MKAMKTRVKMLKVKIKSLAEEARIIRLEEGRARGHVLLRDELRDHRVKDVRKHQRHSLLAYGFLRGKSYQSMEKKADHPPDWKLVAVMVEKFGTTGWVTDDKYDAQAKAMQALAFKEWMAVKV